jgi:hypothetical protein
MLFLADMMYLLDIGRPKMGRGEGIGKNRMATGVRLRSVGKAREEAGGTDKTKV